MGPIFPLILTPTPYSTPQAAFLQYDIGHTVCVTHKALAQDKLLFQVPIGLSACAMKR